MLSENTLPACPIATTIQLVGNKWKLLIIRNLAQRPWRFNELHRDLAGISQKVLTENLRNLEKNGLITRTVYAEVPPRVEYKLSEIGRSLQPLLDTMAEFGSLYKKLVNESNPEVKE